MAIALNAGSNPNGQTPTVGAYGDGNGDKNSLLGNFGDLLTLISEDAENLETIYEKTIAQKFFYEKKLIVKELEKHGVYAILTKPKNLSVNVINKYLEFKSKGLI